MNSDERKAERRLRKRTRRNPHGLGLSQTLGGEEAERRRTQMILARDTGFAALDRLEEIRSRCFTGNPGDLPPLHWWGEET